MIDIDWSKAPEEATHYGYKQNGYYAGWYIIDFDNNEFYFKLEGDIDVLERISAPTKKRLNALVARPKANPELENTPEIDWSKAPKGCNYAFTTGPKWNGAYSLIGTVEFAYDADGVRCDGGGNLVTGSDSWVLIGERPKENSSQATSVSDGSTATYYELPDDCTELQHLISYKNMNAQIGEIFRACYRYGEVSHSAMLRDAKKIKFYADAEIERLEKLEDK